MSEGRRRVLCFAVEQELREELLVKAVQLTNHLEASCSAVILTTSSSTGLESLGSFGAEKVYVVSDAAFEPYNPEVYASALADLFIKLEPDLVLISGTQPGKELAAGVAQRLGTACISDVVRVEASDSSLRIRGSIFSGRGEAVYEVSAAPTLATVVPQYLPPEATLEGEVEVEEISYDLQPPKVKVGEVRAKEVFDRGLERAEVVVDFGQGVKEREHVDMIEKLAGLVGGKVSCTRPISSELEWLPDFVGLSGKRIAPRFCLTVGVAGAVQHMIGLRDALLIAAINNDEDAAIFSQADYGIVGDLYEIVPALIEALEARGYSG